MSETRFGIAGLGDVPHLALLIEKAYRGEDAARGWTNEAALLTGPRSSSLEVEALVRDPDSRFVTAMRDGRLVGCALIQLKGDHAHFGMFAIDPDHQGNGLGRQLIAAAEDSARTLWGCASMRLAVISLRDELIAWYERRGFVRTGEREPFPFETATGAMRRDFDLVVLSKPL